MTNPTCPICGKPATQRGNSSFPFCSQRCRVTDLGRWLDERYRVVVRSSGESDSDEDGAATDPVPDD